jgi:DNA-binding NtrC family response regulator
MPSILIVDDEADVRQILGEMAQRFGYDVRVAATAAEALAATRAERPDAILLDIALPDANETAALDRLRSTRPDVPIIMVTANADIDVARATLSHGAFDYVMKPFDVAHLADVLQTALDGSSP